MVASPRGGIMLCDAEGRERFAWLGTQESFLVISLP